MPHQGFSLPELREAGEAIYGRGWQAALARDLNLRPSKITSWFSGKLRIDIRKALAELCRQRGVDNPSLLMLAEKIERPGPSER